MSYGDDWLYAAIKATNTIVKPQKKKMLPENGAVFLKRDCLVASFWTNSSNDHANNNIQI